MSAREKVWVILSEMFLDGHFADMPDASARVPAASPYDLKTLERIVLNEVFPVCVAKLRSVAGIWAGFDERDLVSKISARKAR